VTARELGALLRARKLSCVELVDQTIGAVRKHEHLHAFITLTEDDARREAAERDRELAQGIDRGPLHGIPTAYKDLFYTRGVRTTAGSLVFRDFVPDYDATVVNRFRQAGAISIGKANLHELAYGIRSQNPHFGFVLNPRDLSRLAGGSSGGSAAAIAAGIVPIAFGSDTGGSIRIPASYCGVAGLKPTYGRVSRYGILPLAFSLDHAGPLGVSVEDCALAMNAVAGPDQMDPSCTRVPVPDFNPPTPSDLKGIRVGVPENFFFDQVDDQVAACVVKTIGEMEHLGARATAIQLPAVEEANAAARVIQLVETASLYARYTDPQLFGADVWALIEQGKMIAGHEYVNAQRIRTLFRREFDRIWQTVDVLAAPTTPVAAPPADATTIRIGDRDEDVRMASTRLCRAINFLGEPALSLPCGYTREGLPVGLQLIGAPFEEPKLLAVGKLVEAMAE
jgi:aspartyl-tRNA(Asn)/glutamyl-tRNA(Gln) amidotransferase subunit A